MLTVCSVSIRNSGSRRRSRSSCGGGSNSSRSS